MTDSGALDDSQQLSSVFIYARGELGILDPSQKTELIDGEIVLISAKGSPDVTALHLLGDSLRDQLHQKAIVGTQDPVYLDDRSEPEADLALGEGTALDYADQHPRPEQIYQIVEVADFTLKQDCALKAKFYALCLNFR